MICQAPTCDGAANACIAAPCFRGTAPPRRRNCFLCKHCHGILEIVNNGLQKRGPKRAVDDPVIDRQRDRHDSRNRQPAIGAHNRFPDARTYGQDRPMGRVDHRVEILAEYLKNVSEF